MKKQNKALNITIKTVGAVAIILVILIITNFNTFKILLGNWFSHKLNIEENAEWNDGTSYEHIQYSDVSKTDYLHLYVPKSDKPLPLYIMVHGGGFFYNDLDSRQAKLFYQHVRKSGYAVATINYRLGQEANYPAAIEDVKAAVRFLRANADKYGIDAEHFAIAGESAGGYLAAMAAVTTDEEFMGVPFIGEENLSQPVSAKVQALVDFYGCMEFFTFDEEFEKLKVPKLVRKIANGWLNSILEGTNATSIEEVWIGKTIDEMTKEELEQYTVPYYAKKNLNGDSDLKVIILHGTADITVPYLQSENFYNLLLEKLPKDNVKYHLIDNYGHAADGFYSADTLNMILEETGF